MLSQNLNRGRRTLTPALSRGERESAISSSLSPRERAGVRARGVRFRRRFRWIQRAWDTTRFRAFFTPKRTRMIPVSGPEPSLAEFSALKWTDDGLIPAIVQDAATG